MKRKPFSALGHHIQIRREQHLFRRRKLARLIGFADSKVGAAAIRLLEETGVVDDPSDLLDRLTVVLHLDPGEVTELAEQDRHQAGEWLRQILTTSCPYIGVRSRPCPRTAEIPDRVRNSGGGSMENYARGFAAYHRQSVDLVLSRRVRIEIDQSGDVTSIRELGRDGWLEDVFSN